jgi:transposase
VTANRVRELFGEDALNALLYVAEHGCKWRCLTKRFGNWHTIYARMNRWSKSGVLDRVFEKLLREQIVRIRIEALSLDSTSIKVHPDGTGTLKKGPQAIGTSRGGWNTKIHLVAADARTAISFALSPDNVHDARQGPALLEELRPMCKGLPMLMDRAYEDNHTRQLVGTGHGSSGSAQIKSDRAVGIRSRLIQETQRDPEALPQTQSKRTPFASGSVTRQA